LESWLAESSFEAETGAHYNYLRNDWGDYCRLTILLRYDSMFA